MINNFYPYYDLAFLVLLGRLLIMSFRPPRMVVLKMWSLGRIKTMRKASCLLSPSPNVWETSQFWTVENSCQKSLVYGGPPSSKVTIFRISYGGNHTFGMENSSLMNWKSLSFSMFFFLHGFSTYLAGEIIAESGVLEGSYQLLCLWLMMPQSPWTATGCKMLKLRGYAVIGPAVCYKPFSTTINHDWSISINHDFNCWSTNKIHSSRWKQSQILEDFRWWSLSCVHWGVLFTMINEQLLVDCTSHAGCFVVKEIQSRHLKQRCEQCCTNHAHVVV